MSMTITEKILAHHAGLKSVQPKQLIESAIDVALGNDITAPIAIKTLRELGTSRLFDRNRIFLVADHFVPNKDIPSAMQVREMRDFARHHQIPHFFEMAGIEHTLLPEMGFVLPGDVIIGADSHTCTYGALGAFATGVGSTDLAGAMITGKVWLRVPESLRFIYYGQMKKWVHGKDLILYTIGDIGVDGALYKTMEFGGEVVERLPMSDRFTMANMAVEAGAKSGIILPDDITRSYVEGRAKRPYEFYMSDHGAQYAEIREYDVGIIGPQVAFPHSPENTRDISDVGNILVDQVFIGSCTNGRLDDLRIAANILKGHRVHPYVRLIIIPATRLTYQAAIREGLIEIFLEAGAVIGPPNCGPCLGGHMGVLAKGERAVATTNRNFVGRMGHPESEVYLANPAIAAASAVLGRIGSPEEVGR
jgi:3-isopropylmalate/(R)-2-methylmalate dehydratase large subunit